MTLTILGADQSALGTWQLDYDDQTRTIAHTATSSDPTAQLDLAVTIVATSQTFDRDITADINQGRTIDFSNIAPSRIPAHVKGDPYPVLFAGTWTA